MPRNWHVRFRRQVGWATDRLSSTQLRKHWADLAWLRGGTLSEGLTFVVSFWMYNAVLTSLCWWLWWSQIVCLEPSSSQPVH